jgi:hypothetical protein
MNQLDSGVQRDRTVPRLRSFGRNGSDRIARSLLRSSERTRKKAEDD